MNLHNLKKTENARRATLLACSRNHSNQGTEVNLLTMITTVAAINEVATETLVTTETTEILVILVSKVTTVTLLTKAVTHAQRSEYYSCPIFRQILVELAKINCDVNPSGGSRGAPGGHTDGRADGSMPKLTVAFHNCFANTPKNRNETNPFQKLYRNTCTSSKSRGYCAYFIATLSVLH